MNQIEGKKKIKSILTFVWDSFLLYKCTGTMNSNSFLSCFNQSHDVDKNLHLNSIMAKIYADKPLKIQKQEHLFNYIFKFECSGFCGLPCFYALYVAFLFCPVLMHKMYFTQSQNVVKKTFSGNYSSFPG